MDLTRRNFLGGISAIAAGTLVPTLRVRPDLDLHRFVAMWCDPDMVGYRYDLSRPFVVDGMSYGTDSRAIGRIITSETDTDQSEKRRLPDVLTVWDRLWKERGRWRPLPNTRLIESTAPMACPDCEADGSLIECPHCDGLGGHIDNDGYATMCPQCKGAEWLSNGACPTCHGKPWGNYRRLQPFGDALIDVAFVRKLQQIPGVMWTNSVGVVSYPDKAWSPILYKSDVGIEGIVMPCKR
jgi:hypothetical protein